MIEPTPTLQTSNEQAAIKMLTNPQYKELFSRIDENYMYWDEVKYKAPEGISPEVLWHAVKLRRSMNVVQIRFGRYQFHFTITGKMQALLHEFDMNFGGNLGAKSIIPERDSTQYLISSIMEEAIASSQMEGASTTRKVAKDMLRKQSKPVNKSQQMILNNYNTIRYLVDNREQAFSMDGLKSIHISIANRTLDNAEDEGRIRTGNDVLVMDGITGEVAHTPPDVMEVEGLLEGLCDFANDESSDPFVHPIVKGIIMHFMISFIHPFVDGNGRTARSIVYWYLLKNGYWMTEYLSISRVIYKSKKKYEKAFLYTEHDELDLTYFINYHLDSMKKAYEELKAYLQKKIKEQQDFYTFRGFSNINERQAQIIKILSEKPKTLFTARELTTRFSISPKTARADLQHLVELGLMSESPINNRTIGYVRKDTFETRLKDLTND